MKSGNILSLFIVFSSFFSLNADVLPGWKGEAKVSAYFPSSKVVRKLYSNVIPLYEVELSRDFYCNWQGWVSAGLLYDRGDSKGTHKRNSITFVPVATGLKYIWPVESCVDFYLGIGAAWAYMHANNHYYYLHQKISDSAFGGVFRTGMTFAWINCLTVDVFTEYLSLPFRFHHCSNQSYYASKGHLNMSGFKLGAGLIYRF